MNLRWLTSALQDLHAHAEYIARDNPAAAGQEFLRVEIAVEKLKEMPLLGKASAVPGVRELIVAHTPYIVAYRVQESYIDILAVFHGAQDRHDELKRRS